MPLHQCLSSHLSADCRVDGNGILLHVVKGYNKKKTKNGKGEKRGISVNNQDDERGQTNHNNINKL